MPAKISNLFWELYPFFYEKMETFPSYKRMMKDIAKNLNPKKGGIYLDLGCGTGNLIQELHLICNDIKTYGVDSSLSSLKIAQSKIKKNKINSAEFCQYRIEDKLPFKDETFDGISAVNLICYLPPSSVYQLIKESKRTLKRNGRLCLVYPNKVSYSKGIDNFKSFVKSDSSKAIISVPFYLTVGLMNLPMRLKTNIRCYEKDYVEALLSKEVFKNIKTEKTYYGETTLLTVGEKI
jgi:ubiquinone/menaquinone biosynthesis C-methylase UbiE